MASKPGAIIRTINGEKIMPKMVRPVRIRTKKVKTTLAKKKASSFALVCKYSVNTGIKATENEPSAKSRLKRFGIRKATKKASAAIPEPKKLAMRISLASPTVLLKKVKKPTIPAALVTCSFSFTKTLDTPSGLVYLATHLECAGGKNVATHKSAIKRGRQSKARRLRNMAYKSSAKTAIKEVGLAIVNNDIERAKASLNKAVSILQKNQSRGVMHKNTASRKISALARQVNRLATVSSEGNKDERPGPPEQDPPSTQT
jgi:small subunit ribosomal protein S20